MKGNKNLPSVKDRLYDFYIGNRRHSNKLLELVGVLTRIYRFFLWVLCV